MGIFKKKDITEERFAHITHEMYKQNVKLNEQNKTLALLQRIDEAVLKSSNTVPKVSQIITDLLVLEESDFRVATIYIADTEGREASLLGFSVYGQDSVNKNEGIKNQLNKVSLEPNPHNTMSYSVGNGDIQTAAEFSDIKYDLTDQESKNLKTALGVNSIFICPLKSSDRLLGVLVLGISEKQDKVSEYIRGLVNRLRGTISIAIENHVLYEEVQQQSKTLKEQNDRLVELDKLKDEFMSMATHQLNTPLTVVDGYITMTTDGRHGPLDDQQKEFLEKALHRVRLMKRLVLDFLNIGRIESGKFVIDPTPTDLNKVVIEEINGLGLAAKEKGVFLHYVPPKDPVPIIELDEQKIHQAIMNLIDNAIFYAPHGDVKVTLDSDENYVIFKVMDNGIGVPEAQKDKLFQKFSRAENARRERPSGTGVGLYLVKRVVEAQGGNIIFESQEGKGSTFGFRFPIKAVAQEEKNIDPRAENEEKTNTIAPEKPKVGPAKAEIPKEKSGSYYKIIG